MSAEITDPGSRKQSVTGRVGGSVPVRMPGQPGLTGPFKPRQMQRAPVLERMHIHPKPDPRQLFHRGSLSGLRREHFVEEGFGLVLVGLLSQGELADEDLTCLRQHPLLAGRKAALLVPAPQIPDDLGHLVHVAGGELLQVGLVPTRPVRGLLGVRRTKHLEHTLKPFGTHHVPYPDEFCVVRWNSNGQVALVDLQDQIGLLLALDRASFDGFDASSPMVRVNDGIADSKRHLASTPSAEGYLTTAWTTDKMPVLANMQVNTPISSTRKRTQRASTTVGTGTNVLCASTSEHRAGA